MIQTIIGAIIGIVTSYVFYIISRTRSRLNYQTSNLQIIGNISLKLPQDFEVTVAGVRINSLQKSQIVIWNGGTTTITGDNIVDSDQLKIVFGPETKIFDANITGQSRKVNKFTVEIDDIDENELLLNFDFLDKKDGVIIEVLHTDNKFEPKISGTIKGLQNGIKYKGQISYLDYNKKLSRSKYLVFFGIILLATILIGTLVYFMAITLAKNIDEVPGFMSYVAFNLGVVIPVFIIISGLYFLNKRKFPKSIKKIIDFDQA